MDEETDATREQALAFYKSVQSYEHHFNSIEFEVRKLASAWLLVSFGAIAFLIRGGLDESHSLAGTPEMIVAVSALAQIGLFMLWMLDQVVYHGLLDAAFTAALHIERRYRELPPLRSLMLRISAGDETGAGGTGMARYLKLFYLLPMAVFAALAGAAAWLSVRRDAEMGAVAGAVALLVVAVPVWVVVKTRRLEAGKRRNRPAAAGALADRPYDLAVERWLRQMEPPAD